ncbi:P-loop containing nucleoside triphosphate hydrolase protein [Lyophyllum atratum]|nr:P-loop containing nucleoside triphosphate hydrolase protein [Lyophyllum atratum]
MAANDQRSVRLNRLLETVLNGKIKLETGAICKQFLEAIYSNPDPPMCVERLIESPHGLSSIRAAISTDTSIDGLNDHAVKFLSCLQAPAIKTLCGGQVLIRVLNFISGSPTFWTAFIKAFKDRKLKEAGEKCFAWVLLSLISIPTDTISPHLDLANDVESLLINSSYVDVRNLGQKIKHTISVSSSSPSTSSGEGDDITAGGRHDNDFAEFRSIAILPTADELASAEAPFLRLSAALDDPRTEDGRVALYLDNQFRLLREDMIYEMREELQIALNQQKGKKHRGFVVEGLRFHDCDVGDQSRWTKWSLVMQCKEMFAELHKVKPAKRKDWLKDHPRFLKHQSLTSLIVDGEVLAFPSVRREEDLLVKEKPLIILELEGEVAMQKLLLRMKSAGNVKLIQIDVAVFAYEPILNALKSMKVLPLSDELLFWKEGSAPGQLMLPPRLKGLVDKMKVQGGADVGTLLGLKKKIILDPAQEKSLLAGLTQNLAIIQGPPGTGKSFIGALLAKFIHEYSDLKILVVCYTNHALDQFLEDLLDVGIASKSMISASLRGDHAIINELKSDIATRAASLTSAFKRYLQSSTTDADLLSYLEFEKPDFYNAFEMPKSGEWSTAGKGGRAVDEFYLIHWWRRGGNAGSYRNASNVRKAHQIWSMPKATRQAIVGQWVDVIRQEEVVGLYQTASRYNKAVDELARKFKEKDGHILKSKRIIGCTTTAAAKYTRNIQEAAPDVVLLILIGDHKTVTSKGQQLQAHRLRRAKFPSIECGPKYPLSSATSPTPTFKMPRKTKGRPDLRGVQDNIIFINHDHPEDELRSVSDMRDMGSKSSKQNIYEARMVLKIVRYLAQQGYGTDKMVVLTPYLGQLHKLQLELKAETDPVLNDLDSYDLIRAGLLTAGSAKTSKRRLRLATIDNYQGEESDIPERLNFTKSKNGGALWQKFFAHIKNHVYDGFPVKCEQHPQRKALLSVEVQFEQICPDGGCAEPCGAALACGLHKCPSKCHQLYDHSKMRCEQIVKMQCPKGHDKSNKCFEPVLPGCKKCDREAKLAEEKRQEEFARQQRRDQEEAEHLRQKKEIERELAEVQQLRRDEQLREERKNEIRQKLADLEEAKSMNQPAEPMLDTDVPTSSHTATLSASTPGPQNVPPAPELLVPATKSLPTGKVPRDLKRSSTATSSTPATLSRSETEWQRKKTIEGVVNPSVDAIMGMTGLEEVKLQVLTILDKIEVAIRQNTEFNKDRYNVSLLGNPGTGKTTVARHYAKFLASVRVLPGDAFEETTGSRIANDGVKGAKDLVEKVINAGGGAIFIDEAYQLASQHNFQGSQVLDFLLAEMENNVGKVVFIIAGYNKQMEKFFEHNPGLSSRVPYTFQFNDYTDDELRAMLEKMVHRKHGGRMKVEDGIHGLYGRIAVRRLGRGRGRDGFGNARALENLLATITSRQAARISEERRNGSRPDDFLLVMEDLIGPDPSTAIQTSGSWEKLEKLTGLASVKRSIKDLYDMIMRNYNRELKEQEPVSVSLNRTFIGSPGTGKTTVAKLYGQILADLGLLSNGEVVVKNPADFIGSALGESENKTKAILANTTGKVLIIDEAYMLYGGGATGQQSDPYKTAVIDTLVAEVQSTLGEDRCVLLLGYEKEMKEMFQNVNPGLSRRFAIEDAFKFEDFTYDELLEILNLKLEIRPNFGNGGEVENVIGKAKANYMTRNRGSSDLGDIVFQPVDFDPSFDRAQHAGDKLVELFKDVVGCDEIVTKLRSIQKTALSAKRRGQDVGDLVPTTFVFKGPPGTGKTTTARKMGEVYFDMGLLARPAVHECSASDIVAQYVGQTGPLVRKTFEKALGQILFIDEAYRLKEGLFAKEATDEIVSLLTDEHYKGKIVVILAGYDDDINQLLAVNRGLSSRFTEEVVFVNLRPEECLQILEKDITQKNIQLPGLADRSSTLSRALSRMFIEFSALESWGNARDVKTLAKKFIGLAMQEDDGTAGKDSSLILEPAKAMRAAQEMLSSRSGRQSITMPQSFDLQDRLFAPPAPLTSNPPVTKTTIKTSTAEAPPRQKKGPESAQDAQLQRAKEAAALEEKRVQEELAEAQRAARAAEEREKLECMRREALELRLAQERDREKQEELKRQREAQRLKEIAARQERERLEAAMKARREAEEKAKKQEAKVQAKLRQMGVCVAGFRWQNIGSGYRCAGGFHYIDNAQLGI